MQQLQLGSMAAVPQLWEAVIKVLQNLPESRSEGTSSATGTDTGQAEALEMALWRIERAHEGRVLPEATWRKMIKAKVRKKCAVDYACQPSAADPTAGCEPGTGALTTTNH